MLLKLRKLMLEFRNKKFSDPSEVEMHPKVWGEILSSSNSIVVDWQDPKLFGMKLIENPRMAEDEIVVR